MKIAYLIQAHNNPRHLERLLATLTAENVSFFLHIDQKSDQGKFLHLARPRLHFVENRVAVHWGDFSQVEATLNLIDAALRSTEHVERLVFISGADYPVRSASAINRFFEQHAQSEFINTVAMPADAAGKPISRLTHYHVRPNASGPRRFIDKVRRKLRLAPRERDYRAYLGNLQPYGGSSWWALTRASCENIMSFVAQNPAVVTFFKNTGCPDESFFQTIIANSDAKARIQPNLTYTEWEAGASSPAYMAERHLPILARATEEPVKTVFGSSTILFARKFSDAQSDIAQQIDRDIIGVDTKAA